ncbi:glucosamine-6-phosphate deaminase [Rhodocaloribacter litoris]|uniref:glucosamine-6-phosphate deaminase n=1 Tax=Rhodocaloribacter litoris TaxID=2558931 RepID=UPI001E49B9FF|nr:glucosamine-6-phosphate deaminase [Rhodocaloribacter litoris]QXD16317.1 glucosamine-6-phosphate deaminase [Rhodocaloribacter litoris]
MVSTAASLPVSTHDDAALELPDGSHRERVPVLIFEHPAQMARQVARRIANLIEERQAVGKNVVLGLPTGSTPIGVYEELVRMHREQGLDFSNVITFNLDEYYPMKPDSLQSYHRFMHEHFFDHVNIPKENIHIPRGDLPREEVEAYCLQYEHAITKAGGLDLVLLGIGRSGHIGFNEPGSGPETRTRLVVLDEITRKDAASDFFGEENVPREAITMGVGTILDAREIILMATGEHKASIVRRAVEEEPNRRVTASFLQRHRDATFYVDRAAAGELTRIKTPWLVREVTWTPELAKRAVIWLSEKLGKAILHLEAADFYRNHLQGLVHAYGNVDDLCRQVFEDLRRRIRYPESLPRKERIIVFSPHPDDDVISMGGMLDKLVRNENEVTVAYMTNGSVAVFDADVRRMLRFVEMSLPALGFNDEAGREAFRKTKERYLRFLKNKKPGEVDLEPIQQLKAYIRYAEAVAAIEVMGLDERHARFLDMPFYKTGTVRKAPIGEADVQVVLELLREIRPSHVFVAGDLSDPHGTHRMCYRAIQLALERYNQPADLPDGEAKDAPQNGTASKGKKKEKAGPSRPAAERPLVWLYRGAWQEWEIDKTDIFIPLSKADLDRKIEAIFKHESQKDRAMFPGAYDEREFWERAKDRNRETAAALNRLGLPEFYAAEAFVTTYEMP